MKRRANENQLDFETQQAAQRLAEWIVQNHGGQDWDVKVEECSEPAAAALGAKYETFRASVARIVDLYRNVAD